MIVAPLPCLADNAAIPPVPIEQTSPSGLYLHLDGAWQSQNLPTVGLGYVATGSNGLVESFHDPQSTGSALSGGLGLVLPPGAMPPGAGANTRVELDARYVATDAMLNGTPAATGGVEMLDGSTHFTIPSCLLALGGGLPRPGGPALCTLPADDSIASSLHLRYSVWQVAAKAATDFRVGSITLTPSVALLGGTGRDSVGWTQNFSETQLGVPIESDRYDANVTLDWRDLGGGIGIDAVWPLSPWLSLGFAATGEIADRDADLRGSDTYALSSGGLSTSAVADSAETTALTSTAEASVNIAPLPGVLLRGFVGVSGDSAVPGVATPRLSGSISAPTTTSPATIKFSSELGWYAGGGAVVRF